MLKTMQVEFYQVKQGQGVEEIAAYFSVSPYLLARKNGLTESPYAGQILQIPTEKGSAYTVQAGDTKALLCGSAERFERLNGTDCFYIGMRVRI